MIDKVESVTVAEIISFIILCCDDKLVYNTHIVEMYVMQFPDECIMISFYIDHLHAIVYAFHEMIHNICFIICSFAKEA